MPSIWQRAPTLLVHGRSGEAILLPYSQKVKLSVFLLDKFSCPPCGSDQVMPYASITDLSQSRLNTLRQRPQ